MRFKSGQLAIALISIILGMMLALQFKVQQAMSKDVPYKRAEEMAAYVKSVEKERDNLQKEVIDLRNKVSDLAAGVGSVSALESELAKAKLLAGLVDVTGPGVTVVLDDSKLPRQKGVDPNVFLIHDDDVLKVVNELAAAGAEAIAVNGQRLVGNSEIRCAGPTISINNVRTAPPIKILAIGNPDTLESALRMRGGVVEALGLWGIEVKIQKESEILIPAYKGSLQFQYARPAKKGA